MKRQLNCSSHRSHVLLCPPVMLFNAMPTTDMTDASETMDVFIDPSIDQLLVPYIPCDENLFECSFKYHSKCILENNVR